ncbi:hypothetical protein PRZ48_011553 [Zasmidium cellare]|uniref:Uncharacterized protein n=1 Tax=Zasmidium cellare TaxID=395010 RepID=A0ABR0E6N6_ZASCE|nr:hypothetical protein PRZ48_011553 [Zasmidium cellare]
MAAVTVTIFPGSSARSTEAYELDRMNLLDHHRDSQQRDLNRVRECPEISRKALLWLAWFAIAIVVIIQAGLIAILVLLVTSAVPPESDADFALYKNSNFKRCAETPSNASVCAALPHLDPTYAHQQWYQPLFQEGRSFLLEFAYAQNQNWTLPVVYNTTGPTWCDIVSCLSDYKINPSTPYDAAFGYTALLAWCNINTVLLVNIWFWKKYYFNDDIHKEGCCEGFSLLDWVLHKYQLASFVFWWYYFVRFVHDPAKAGPLKLLTWLTTWNWAFSTQFHPVSCWLSSRRRSKNLVIGALCLLTFIHFLATIYIFANYGPQEHFDCTGLRPRYKCLEAQLRPAPGTSVCSAQELCGKEWLLSDPGFAPSERFKPTPAALMLGEGVLVLYMMVVSFAAILSFSPLYVLAYSYFAYVVIEDSQGSFTALFKHNWEKAKLPSTTALIAVMWLGTVITAIVMAVGLNGTWDIWDREAPVAYDIQCRALHIAMSPWRLYFDVNGYGRTMRIVSMLFNA